MPWYYCTVLQVQNRMGSSDTDGYPGFVSHVIPDDPDHWTEDLIAMSSAEIIGYIKDVVDPAIWGSWDPVSAPFSIQDACITLTICRLLPQRDSPMAPGVHTRTELECQRIRDWLQKVHDGELELEVDMMPGELGGLRVAIVGEDREAVF